MDRRVTLFEIFPLLYDQLIHLKNSIIRIEGFERIRANVIKLNIICRDYLFIGTHYPFHYPGRKDFCMIR